MKKIVIVGVGALGSHLLLFLRAIPDVQFTIIDDDRVEQKNLLSQFHTRMGVGRNKAQALSQLMHGLYGMKVEAIPHRLVKENAATLLSGAALVIDCLDNAASRALVQETVRSTGVPCVHGALAADGELGRIVWDAHFTIDAEPDAGAATCAGGEHLPFITTVAAQLAWVVQQFFVNNEQLNRQVFPSGLSTF